MTAQEFLDLANEFQPDILRMELVEGAKHRYKFQKDAASYESSRVKASSILLEVVGSPAIVKAVSGACVAEAKRRARNEADAMDEKAKQLRDAIEE